MTQSDPADDLATISASVRQKLVDIAEANFCEKRWCNRCLETVKGEFKRAGLSTKIEQQMNDPNYARTFIRKLRGKRPTG